MRFMIVLEYFVVCNSVTALQRKVSERGLEDSQNQVIPSFVITEVAGLQTDRKKAVLACELAGAVIP